MRGQAKILVVTFERHLAYLRTMKLAYYTYLMKGEEKFLLVKISKMRIFYYALLKTMKHIFTIIFVRFFYSFYLKDLKAPFSVTDIS